MIDKNLVLINYLKDNASSFGIEDFKIKSEYSLDDKDINVVVVQMQQGKEVLFCGNINDYFMIQIFGQSIKRRKTNSSRFKSVIGRT